MNMKPAGQLAHNARVTNIFNKEFLKENLNDPSLADGILKKRLYEARKTSIILGSVLIIALISIVYAFVQQTMAKAYERKLSSMNIEHSNCLTGSEKQKGFATEAQLIAKEVNEMAMEQLQACLRSKKGK